MALVIQHNAKQLIIAPVGRGVFMDIPTKFIFRSFAFPTRVVTLLIQATWQKDGDQHQHHA
tara:strand:- start:2621 stop:2803 length:183 start_codon:yes stop_codon:yes gene_type:complete